MNIQAKIPAQSQDAMPAEAVEGFGSQMSVGRAGQPREVATAYLFLCSSDGGQDNGQPLHPNEGMIVGG